MALEQNAKLFKALSDPNRLRILKMLKVKKLCVCEITEVLNLAASTVSEHLSILKRAGFIIEEKDGKWVNYIINSNSENPTVSSVLSMLPFWISNDTIVNDDLVKINSVDRNKLCSR